MYLYNSATHKKEEFRTHTPGHVEMYTCGPTVYHFAHIGNLRSYIMEDVLEKFLRYSGYSVNRVMNITDVGHLTSDADEGEDKMLKGARREHKTVMEVAKYYTDAFFDDCRKLNIKRPDVVQPATGLIDDYIKIITKLLDTGYAYFAGGNVYFDTSKLERYYVFNDHNEEDLAVGVREGVEEDANKRNKNDFVLWFTKSKFEDQALKWDSPWGVGYPGWHIECSAMANKYLGKTIDIHSGGMDLIFPHHENEVAQSEAANGSQFAHYWLHNGYINVDNRKMSKSLNNFFTVRDVAKEFDYEVIRFFMLSAHYRNPINFDNELMEQAKSAVERVYTCIDNLEFLLQNSEDRELTDSEKEYSKTLDDCKTKFIAAMDDDLNTADAIAAIFDIVYASNTALSNENKNAKVVVEKTLDLIHELGGVLGLFQKTQEKSIDAEVEELIEKRNKARSEKNWAEADAIRDKLKAMNIELKDTPMGVKWNYISE